MHRQIVKPVHWLLAVALLCQVSGCAAIKAGNQPRKKDLSFLEPGTHRRYVIGELGTPIHSEPTLTGRRDRYAFVQGYSKGVRGARKAGHIFGDMCTLGLWEIAAGPIEDWASGTPVEVRVEYNNADRIVSVIGEVGWDALSEYGISRDPGAAP